MIKLLGTKWCNYTFNLVEAADLGEAVDLTDIMLNSHFGYFDSVVTAGNKGNREKGSRRMVKGGKLLRPEIKKSGKGQ
ncbi:MAG: hypothetical protein K6B41_02385 [Butyrivibrio sp.]|nr:hypothetical protein [Butyrivibrio sp.]